MLKRKVAEIWRVFTRRRGDAEEGGEKAESGNLRDESGPLAHGKACRQTVRQAGWAVFWLAADVVRSVQLLHAGAPTRR